MWRRSLFMAWHDMKSMYHNLCDERSVCLEEISFCSSRCLSATLVKPGPSNLHCQRDCIQGVERVAGHQPFRVSVSCTIWLLPTPRMAMNASNETILAATRGATLV